MRDALATQCACRFGYVAATRSAHMGVRACAGEVPHVQALNLTAFTYAAHAADAFGSVANEREIGGVLLLVVFDRVGDVGDVQCSCVALDHAVAVARACGAFAFMARKNKRHRFTAGGNDTGAHGVYHHALGNFVVAGGNELVSAFHLYNTDAAGADFVNVFQVAQRGNHGACLIGGVQDGGVLGNGDFLPVDGQRYHARLLPPLNAP